MLILCWVTTMNSGLDMRSIFTYPHRFPQKFDVLQRLVRLYTIMTFSRWASYSSCSRLKTPSIHGQIIQFAECTRRKKYRESGKICTIGTITIQLNWESQAAIYYITKPFHIIFADSVRAFRWELQLWRNDVVFLSGEILHCHHRQSTG